MDEKKMGNQPQPPEDSSPKEEVQNPEITSQPDQGAPVEQQSWPAPQSAPQLGDQPMPAPADQPVVPVSPQPEMPAPATAEGSTPQPAPQVPQPAVTPQPATLQAESPVQPGAPQAPQTPESPAQPAPQSAAQPAFQPAEPSLSQEPAPQPTQPVSQQPTVPQPAPEGVTQPQQPVSQPVSPTGDPLQQAAPPVGGPVQQPAPSVGGPVRQPGFPQPQPQQPGSNAGYVPQPPNPPSGIKPKGTASLVCGILAIPIAPFSPLVSIILGVVALVLDVRATRFSGKNAKATAGKICGIIGIVFAVIMFVVTLVFTFGTITDQALNASSSSSYSSSSTYGSPDLAANLDVDEQACYDLGIQQLEAMKNQDQAVIDELSEMADKSFDASYGVEYEDVGIKTADIVRWYLNDFEYTFDGVYADPSDGTATMYADLDLPDPFSLSTRFYDLSADFYASDKVLSMTDEEINQQIGKYWTQAMEETTDRHSYYTAIDFVQNEDGTWSIDEDAWEEELMYIFGFYY